MYLQLLNFVVAKVSIADCVVVDNEVLTVSKLLTPSILIAPSTCNVSNGVAIPTPTLSFVLSTTSVSVSTVRSPVTIKSFPIVTSLGKPTVIV